MLPAQVAAGATTPLAGHLLLPAARNTQQDPRKTSDSSLPSKGSFSICLPPEREKLFLLQKSLPAPCLEQKVPAQVEAWKRLRDLGRVGNKPFPQIPTGELRSRGTQVWGGSAPPGEGLVVAEGDKETHCHL